METEYNYVLPYTMPEQQTSCEECVHLWRMTKRYRYFLPIARSNLYKTAQTVFLLARALKQHEKSLHAPSLSRL